MAQADALPTDPKMIEEMLRQRGLLATNGNIRLAPLGDPSGSVTSPVGTAGSATANALAASNGGGFTVPDISGKPTVIPANALELPANVSDDTFMNLLPALAGAGGAALALLIKNHLASKGITPPTTDALAPLPPMAAAADTNGIVDGEFTEVNDPKLAAPVPIDPNAPQIAEQKLLPAPKNTLADTNASGKPKYLTSRELAKRKGANLPTREGSGPAISMADDYGDLSDAEMKQAKTIADSLIERRTQGRYRKYVQRKPGVGRDHLPTGEIDKEGAFNLVVRAIRDAKLNPGALRKAVAR